MCVQKLVKSECVETVTKKWNVFVIVWYAMSYKVQFRHQTTVSRSELVRNIPMWPIVEFEIELWKVNVNQALDLWKGWVLSPIHTHDHSILNFTVYNFDIDSIKPPVFVMVVWWRNCTLFDIACHTMSNTSLFRRYETVTNKKDLIETI